ncbi:MAG: hypothetical protein ABUS57_00985 [Pseudomonadota bacterium]
MAKDQKRNNRETGKPRQLKKLPATPALGAADSLDPIRATFAKGCNGGKTH